jgi:4-amino-4-deoxy-L-arabinose transferase-like glycosyltransferase
MVEAARQSGRYRERGGRVIVTAARSLRLKAPSSRTVWLWAVALIACAAVARVGWAAWIAHAEPSAVRDYDTPGYLAPARALVDAGRYSITPTDPIPMFIRTPGYPVFLASILWLTDSQWAISLIQAIVSLLAVAAIVWVGRRLIGPTAGLVAGAVVALDPLLFVASGTLLSESLTAVVMSATVAVGAVVFALRSPAQVPHVAVFALGALAAVATMVRPTFWFYPAVIVVLLAVRLRLLPRRALVAQLLVFILPIALVVGGWQLRNHARVGSWQVSAVPSINLYCDNAAEVEADLSGASLKSVMDRFGCLGAEGLDTDCERQAGWSCWVPDPDAAGQGFDELGREARQILLDHPFQTGRVLGEGLVREIAGPGTDTVARYLGVAPSPALTGILLVWNATLWGFAAIGAVIGLRSRDRTFWAFVVATIGYVMLVSAGAAAYARLRTPVIPLLALVAALGARHCVRRSVASDRRSRTATIVGRRQPERHAEINPPTAGGPADPGCASTGGGPGAKT